MRDAARPDESAPHHDSVPSATPRSDRRVEEASEESFPASDPPTFTPTGAGRVNRQAAGGFADAPLPPSDTVTPQSRQWADALVTAMDREDLEAIGALLTEDAAVRWGEGPLLVGRAASLRRVEEWFRMSGPLERHVTDVRGDDDAVFIELEVRGTRHGSAASWPEAVSARLRQGAASRVTVYGALPGETVDDAEPAAADDPDPSATT
jgi:ketosteroid isomerase-like protein